MKVPKGMVRYEVAGAKAKPADNSGRATTMAVGEEGGGGGVRTTMAVGEEGGGPGRITTMAVGEEGGQVTTQAVGEEGGQVSTQAVGEEGGSVTTKAVGEEGGVTTLALGEEGGGGGQSTFTAKVTTLLSDKKINNEANDYKAYGRPGPGGGPSPLFGQQFKFGKAEAVKLSKSITANYEPAAQKKILKEIYARSESSVAKGTVALTRDAAAELNKLAKKLGLDLKFDFNQARPMHPVG